MSLDVIFRQILIIFGYVIVGFVCGKLGIINPEQRKYLNKLCSTLIVPFTILSATDMEADTNDMQRFFIAVLVMFAVFCLTTVAVQVISRLLHLPVDLRTAYTGLLTYPNGTFLGLPLCTALFGDWAILYCAALIISFNTLFFTVQVTLFSGEKADLKKLLTVNNGCTLLMAVMLACGIHLPSPVMTVVNNIGGMVTPLSLIIVGVMVSESNLSEVFREKRAYLVVLLRNFAIPLAVMAVLRLLPFSSEVRLCILVYLATPCATLPGIYAMQYDVQAKLYARTILLSTMVFAVSLPVMILLGQSVL